MTKEHHLRQKNRTVMIALASVVFGMMALSFASAPLYSLFCRVTGFGGTPQRVEKGPDVVIDRVVSVRFNADIHPNLSWDFSPHDKRIEVNVGQQALTSYTAKNLTNKSLTGVAVYNVTPEKAGVYFSKIDCFCFAEQTLSPRQSVDMPVLFYIDPAMANDPNMDDVDVITLSYTFFQAKSSALNQRLENDAAFGSDRSQGGFSPQPKDSYQ